MAMKVEQGIVGIADTRITSGTQCSLARKVTIFERPRHSMFIMSSGLRSARDKALTYFNEVLEERDETFDKLYKAVNAFGNQVRRVHQEDREALAESGLPFNLYCIIGGQLEKDDEPKLYLLYPEANWVEVSRGTPYHAIGESAYGKPILDRALTFETDMKTALKIGFLAFDATRAAATDVDYPIDVVLYKWDSYRTILYRFQQEDLINVGQWWQQRIRKSINELPSEWIEKIASKANRVTSIRKK
jgi:putative proteasome-type protease